MENYQYKTTPFEHQVVALDRSAYAPYYGLLMEQRTGKSKVICDTAAILHRDGKINALVIVAPNGVHRNWVSDEIKIHLPDWVDRTVVAWTGATTQQAEKQRETLYNPGHHLRIFAVNFEALVSTRGYEFTKRFLQSTTAMLVVDESTRIKNPDATVTKKLMKLRDLALYRRILNGTPVTQSPLDVFSQLLFLHDDAVPTQSWACFRTRYATYLSPDSPLIRGIMQKGAAKYPPKIIATNAAGQPMYKNLEDLKSWVDRCCYRVTRAEIGFMPAKLYKRWEVEIPSQQQQRIKGYLRAMKEGHTPEPITKMVGVMLYQRMLCGIIPKQLTGTGEDEKMYPTPADNPRLKALLEIMAAYPDSSMVIWARFRSDLTEISNLIEEVTGKKVGRYWGDIPAAERDQAKDDFQAKRVQYFIGQQAAGGVGLPLHAADVVVYHSNTFSLYHRLQSEDRAENLAKKTSTLIIDLEAPGSVDVKIVDALRAKRDVADLITGDTTGDWLCW